MFQVQETEQWPKLIYQLVIDKTIPKLGFEGQWNIWCRFILGHSAMVLYLKIYFLPCSLVGIYTPSLLPELPANPEKIMQTAQSLCHILHPLVFSHLNWALCNIYSSVKTHPWSLSSINTPTQLFQDYFILAWSDKAKSSGLHKILQVGSRKKLLYPQNLLQIIPQDNDYEGTWLTVYLLSIYHLISVCLNPPEPKVVYFPFTYYICVPRIFFIKKPLHFLVILCES